MSIQGWWAGRRRRRLEAYDENFGHATAEEQQEIKRRSRLWVLSWRNARGLPEGTGMSPTGTPIDFTADQKPPRY